MRALMLRIARAALSVAVLVALPIGMTSSGAPAVKNAYCQTGTCCPDVIGTCVIGQYVEPKAYYLADGSCPDDP